MEHGRQLSVKEMKRILKPNGQAYISLGGGPPWGYVDKAEWENIMAGFKIEKEGGFKEKRAVVSLQL